MLGSDLNGKGIFLKWDICIHIVGSFCYTVETKVTILQSKFILKDFYRLKLDRETGQRQEPFSYCQDVIKPI